MVVNVAQNTAKTMVPVSEILKLNVLICFFILRGSDVLLLIYLLDYYYLEICWKCPPIGSKKYGPIF